MPRELLYRVMDKLDLFYPPFLDALLGVLAACKERGAHYVPYMGFRTFAEQAKLNSAYMKKVPGAGKAAPSGLSAHNYGLAADLVLDTDPNKPGLQPDWSKAAYKILIEETERAGLVSGHTFSDSPHVQWPGYVHGHDLAGLKRVYEAAMRTHPLRTSEREIQSLAVVWRHIDLKAS